jgi:hypothetical protein
MPKATANTSTCELCEETKLFRAWSIHAVMASQDLRNRAIVAHLVSLCCRDCYKCSRLHDGVEVKSELDIKLLV